MDCKSIAEGIAFSLDASDITVDDQEVTINQYDDGGHGPTDLLVLSDAEGRGLGAYRLVVEPVDAGVMDFPAALHAAKAGSWIARAGWSTPGMHVRLVELDGMLPFLAMRTVRGDHVPWVASQTDVLAEDWIIIHSA